MEQGLFGLCGLPCKRKGKGKGKGKGEEVEKDRDSREDTLRAAMDVNCFPNFKVVILFFLGVFFLFGLSLISNEVYNTLI